MSKKLCWSCVYGENRAGGSVTCMNQYVMGFDEKPDPYYCEFYDSISDDYLADMDKVYEVDDER